MYCGQCGKKVMENMLFCPFCGSPIVIPEQDVQAKAKPAAAEAAPVPAETAAPQEENKQPERDHTEGPVSLFEGYDWEEKPAPRAQVHAEPELFVPLKFDFDAPEAAEEYSEDEKETASAALDIPEAVQQPAVQEAEAEAQPDRPVRHPKPEFRQPERGSRRPANTYIPIKELDPDDMFMDGMDSDDDYDEYDEDEYDAPAASSRRRYDDDEDDFDFEEPEHGSFFQRHIRGIVGLILLLIMAVICAAWVFSPKGQLSLAKVNLAWKAQPYADLGYEAYQADSDLMAARYYEKALSRDIANYEYAHSAMVAYYEADEIESAAAMLKMCIEMAPTNPEPYQEMLILYPDPQTRPWEISELIRLGYQRTGEESLNIG